MQQLRSLHIAWPYLHISLDDSVASWLQQTLTTDPTVLDFVRTSDNKRHLFLWFGNRF